MAESLLSNESDVVTSILKITHARLYMAKDPLSKK